MTAVAAIPTELRGAVEVLWSYHDMHHDLGPTDVGVGLGSHDLGVATCTADLYHRALFPRIVFTGANAPTTVERFPRGEAVHYREHALTLDVPDSAILVEPTARNTGENITRTRDLLAAHGLTLTSITLISRPYQQRRAYATCRKLWPEVTVQCASHPMSLDDYVTGIGDAHRVMAMLAGDTQRIWLYADRGFAIAQPVPDDVHHAYRDLVNAGHTSRLIT
ncbi:YdcF family protein [Frankia sp. AgKG'84/4]|uniref:YdcF family protein n=1 Tax=Frankia sp. AgKG'84/4 TaxID=573490 RepID=UPI00200CADE4|nr:YdcF family protein [Frankia sp. AgKG'84/4]MCL9794281.1 YdcF family protein [Frankia sp. AgKG'84/4]